MNNISKQIFLKTIACPALGWLMRSGREIEALSYQSLSLGERFRIEQGLEIGRRARILYPEGLPVRGSNWPESVEHTLALMSDKKTSVLFEAAFQVGEFVAKADILKRCGEGWYLIEVKSDTHDKPELLDDLAYTAMVIMQSGVDLKKASLMLISKDYRLGMDDGELFTEVDHTDDCFERAESFKDCKEQVKEATSASTMPGPDLQLICKNCQLFKDCFGKETGNHILELPRLSEKRFSGLKEQGVSCISGIPDSFELTERQAMVRRCVIDRSPWVSKELKKELALVEWPAFYLDFETTMMGIPLYPGVASYARLVIQYSLHKCAEPGIIQIHRCYLCDHTIDDRRNLAEKLIQDLEKTGSIITYSNFEKTTVNDLARTYPDLAEKLGPIADRMVDLEAIVRNGFYHHEFHGSTSIKVTLPALVPEMSYHGFEIADGASASAAFACLAMGKHKTGAEAEQVRANLLKYCAQDTIAMVKLHERLLLLAWCI